MHVGINDSLNMMGSKPRMYIAAYANPSSVKEGLFKQCVSLTCDLGSFGNDTYVLTPLCFDTEQQSLNETCNLQASAVIKSHNLKYLLQYSDKSIMVCGLYEAMVVDVDKMVKLKTIKLKAAPIHSAEEAPSLSAHTIPGTDYKFFLVFVDS